MNWIKFFAGTPKRFAFSIIALAAVIGLDKLGYFVPLVESALSLVQPFVGPVALVLILGVAFRIMLGGRRRK